MTMLAIALASQRQVQVAWAALLAPPPAQQLVRSALPVLLTPLAVWTQVAASLVAKLVKPVLLAAARLLQARPV